MSKDYSPRRMTRATSDVLNELSANDVRWGAQHDDQHTIEDWALLLEERPAHMVFDQASARHLLVQQAAIAIAAIESIDRKVPA